MKRTLTVALKQSHVNQLQKIISAAEKLIGDLEREVQSTQNEGGRAARSGKDEGRAGRGRPSGRPSGKTSARGLAASSARQQSGRASTERRKNNSNRTSGTRRNRAQTAEFRKSILRELESGTTVADLAAKHGVTPAYVYQIKSRAEA